MAKWTTATRKAYYKAHPENFADGDSYPIETASDVPDAWDLAGQADNPDAVRAKIKSIAKRLGFADALPETAKEGEDKDDGGGTQRAMKTRTAVDAKGQHAPFTGTHTHSHSAMGEQGDDAMHEHEHSHDGDAEHAHSHADGGAATERVTAMGGPVSMYFPITRSVSEDGKGLVVRGQCTSEAIDSYKTIFDYPSAKHAMERWRGNIREQHDAKKAVGRRLDWAADDANKRIMLTGYVSRTGSPDTCAKVEEDILTGWSVQLKPGYKSEYVTVNGQRVLRYYDYDYAEISLVDAPGSPGCDVVVLRADGEFTDVLAVEDEPVTLAAPPESTVERAGAAVSADRMDAMHQARDSALLSARQMAGACPCAACQAIVSALDPDGDGDVDVPGADGTLDPDDDGEDLAERVLAIVERRLAPTITRYQAIAGDLSRLNVPQVDLAPVQRVLDAVQAQITALGNTQELVSRLDAMDGQVSRLDAIERMVKDIHETPMPGGPVLRSPDKRLLAVDSSDGSQGKMSNEEVVRRATAMGIVDPVRMTPQQQVNAARNVIQPISQ